MSGAGTDPAGRGGRQRRALVVALGLNAAFLVVELVGGIAFRSLALLADAAHMLSDVAALGIALAAHRLIDRPATEQHSFGFQRAEVVGAQVNGFILLAASGWIVYEALQRVGEEPQVVGGGLLAVASAGLAVNLVAAWVIHRVHEGSLNLRGALLHLLADALGSVGAIAAGVAVVVWGAGWADPVISVAIAGLVVWSAWRLLRETTHVLLEGAPRSLDVDEVRRAVASHPEVEDVHHVHVWSLGAGVTSMSAHVVVATDLPLHEAQVLSDALKDQLAERFDIDHATLEMECHICEPEAEGTPPH